MSFSTENVAIAFAIVTGAGLSTTLGAAVVFCDAYVTLASKRVLAGSLGFSGGVMMYVSFVEIFQKSILAFEQCNCLWDANGAPYIAATICFFCGIMLTNLLAVCVHCISRRTGHGHSHDLPNFNEANNVVHDEGRSDGHVMNDEEDILELAIEDFQGELEQVQEKQKVEEVTEKDRLNHMGLMTAVAIALHNFPEGLATFVAALDEPAVGAALAVALAIHNIPEGICVSVPIYYATGSRWKGFWLAFWSGVTEIIAAILGYAFLMSVFSETAFGVLFGLVSGMMVAIVLTELLPTALRTDEQIVAPLFFLGMLTMALSLIFFVI